MARINTRRVLLGALAGGVLWNVWSLCINLVVLAKRYAAAQEAGYFLKQPRYAMFPVLWIVLLFALAFIVAWLYASARATRGAGPRTALEIGVLVGFASGFPNALGVATWAPFTRVIPLWQMLELWVGAVIAALVAGMLYRE